jgi:DNA segregation ATPase FtsK/SpoIIIE, S-DNA-T family
VPWLAPRPKSARLSDARRVSTRERISARELRDRTWWTGPDLYLVADDYDLL